MKLSHRIRAHMIKREAAALLRRANRPHKQSKHMIGCSKWVSGPEALVSAAVAIALVAIFSLVVTESVPADSPVPAQVANQK